MTSNPPVRGAHDIMGVNPQQDRADPPLGNPPLLREYQVNENGAGMVVVQRVQAGRLVPGEDREPAAVLRAHLLGLMPGLIRLTHLPPNDLEHVIAYVSAVGAEAGFGSARVERFLHVLLVIGYINHWSVDSMEQHAEWAIRTEDDEPVVQNVPGVEGGHGRGALEPMNEFPPDRRIGLERQGGLIPAIVREPANARRDLPPAYTREPVAPRPGAEIPRANSSGIRYSIKLGSGGVPLFRVEVFVSFVLLRAIAYSGAAGMTLIIFGLDAGVVGRAANRLWARLRA